MTDLFPGVGTDMQLLISTHLLIQLSNLIIDLQTVAPAHKQTSLRETPENRAKTELKTHRTPHLDTRNRAGSRSGMDDSDSGDLSSTESAPR